MNPIDNLLKDISHRPWPLPLGPWRYYQKWNDALFLHWRIDPAILFSLVPASLPLDLIDGQAWVSLVAFRMEGLHPGNLPAVSFLSSFYEINVRTYVIRDGKPGVYFLHIEAEKWLAAFVARLLSGLPYEKADILRKGIGKGGSYISRNTAKGFHLEAGFETGNAIVLRSVLDNWLTERYCLYLDKGPSTCRFDVHHKIWELHEVRVLSLAVHYKIGGLVLSSMPDLVHYSPGVEVLSWDETLV